MLSAGTLLRSRLHFSVREEWPVLIEASKTLIGFFLTKYILHASCVQKYSDFMYNILREWGITCLLSINSSHNNLISKIIDLLTLNISLFDRAVHFVKE